MPSIPSEETSEHLKITKKQPTQCSNVGILSRLDASQLLTAQTRGINIQSTVFPLKKVFDVPQMSPHQA